MSRLSALEARTTKLFIDQAIVRTKVFYRSVANMVRRLAAGTYSNGNLYSYEDRCQAIRAEIRVALANIQRITGPGGKPKLNSPEWRLRNKLKYLENILLPPLQQQIIDRQAGPIKLKGGAVHQLFQDGSRPGAVNRVRIEGHFGGTILLDGSDI